MDPLPARPQPSRPFTEVIHAWLQWFGVARLVVTALAILGVGAGGYWLLRAPPTAIENSLPYARPSVTAAPGDLPGATTTASTPMSSTPLSSVDLAPVAENESVSVYVYVAGAVVSPGVYRLSGDARIEQAIVAAGGRAPDADIDAMNLAAFLHDGDRIYVPHVGHTVPAVIGATSASGGVPAPAGQAPPGASAELVDLNRASLLELDALPGVGPATAAAIIARREQSGPYSTVDDLLKVPGIGPAKVDALRAMVKV